MPIYPVLLGPTDDLFAALISVSPEKVRLHCSLRHIQFFQGTTRSFYASSYNRVTNALHHFVCNRWSSPAFPSIKQNSKHVTALNALLVESSILFAYHIVYYQTSTAFPKCVECYRNWDLYFLVLYLSISINHINS